MHKDPGNLWIVLDTNAIYLETDGDEVITPALARVINDPLHQGLNIVWAVPEMVRMEREYQLWGNAKHAVSAAQKVPKIFAGALSIDQDKVQAQISGVVGEAFRQTGLQVIECAYDDVNWRQLVHAAGYRRAPFDPDPKKEKGFKDAIIAETFIQLCKRLDFRAGDGAIMVTDDEMLRENVTNQVGASGPLVVRDLDALSNELNFMVSDIESGTANELQISTGGLLSNVPDFWSEVNSRIDADLMQYQQTGVPPGTINPRVTKRLYNPAVFLEKRNRRAVFLTKLNLVRVGEIWTPVAPPPPVPPTNHLSIAANGLPQFSHLSPAEQLGMLANSPPSHGLTAAPLNQGLFGLGLPQQGEWKTTALPALVFEVRWSIDFSQEGGKLSLRPQTIACEAVRFEGLGPAYT